MYELKETNHGIDGWDAKTRTKALFSTYEKAQAWLQKRGYALDGSEYYPPPEKRGMGMLSYKIVPATEIAVDPV